MSRRIICRRVRGDWKGMDDDVVGGDVCIVDVGNICNICNRVGMLVLFDLW